MLVLFDFFGTLVDYSPSRTEQGFHRSHQLLYELGADLSYERFLDLWSGTCAEFDRRSDRDDREYSMAEVGGALLTRALGRAPAPAAVEDFIARYLAEWNAGVAYPAGVPELVSRLADTHRLAVVTNTHHATLVPDHLSAMGRRSSFEAVITSVEVGWRKPHPAIYTTALAKLGGDASSAVFVGDTYEPDFLGPRRAGIRAFLIDPHRRAPVPEACRLQSILDLPDRLAGAHLLGEVPGPGVEENRPGQVDRVG